MLDIHLLRENPKILLKDLKKRKDTEKIGWVKDLLEKDEAWRKATQQVEKLRAKRNQLTVTIVKKKKAKEDTKKEIKQAQALPKKIKALEEKQEKLKKQIDTYLYKLPNIMHKSVPYGKDDQDNVQLHTWGKTTKKKFPLKSHQEIGEKLNVLDFESSAKIAGNGFYFLKGDLALLNQAIIHFAIGHLTKKGYSYIEPPLIMNTKTYKGVTDLEAFNDVLYKIEGQDLHLIATSEHPLVAQFANQTIQQSCLPIKLVGYSMCFRKEVGSTGVDTKGLFRTHQFNKVEQVIVCEPKDSWKLHEELLKNAESMLKKLKLPYRVVNICTGDLGIVAAKKYDIEVWMPRQKKYREAMSCSNCTDYQARRLNIKYTDNKTRALTHTLNSTAIATSRILVAILENNQQKDGSVKIPLVLQPYMNGRKKIQ